MRYLIIIFLLSIVGCNSNSIQPTTPNNSTPNIPFLRPQRILLWVGPGTWTQDVIDNKLILNNLGIRFDPVTSLIGVDYNKYSAIIMPGGTAKVQSNGIAARLKGSNAYAESVALGSEKDRLRQAINNGLGYLGYCAGAFLTGDYGSWGLKLFPVDIPYPNVIDPSSLQMVPITTHCCGTTEREMLYYGGPGLGTVGGQVIGEFQDGGAAIIQARVGSGLVILSSVHPESSPDTIALLGLFDPDGEETKVNQVLIKAVLNNEEVTLQ